MFDEINNNKKLSDLEKKHRISDLVEKNKTNVAAANYQELYIAGDPTEAALIKLF